MKIYSVCTGGVWFALGLVWFGCGIAPAGLGIAGSNQGKNSRGVKPNPHVPFEVRISAMADYESFRQPQLHVVFGSYEKDDPNQQLGSYMNHSRQTQASALVQSRGLAACVRRFSLRIAPGVRCLLSRSESRFDDLPFEVTSVTHPMEILDDPWKIQKTWLKLGGKGREVVLRGQLSDEHAKGYLISANFHSYPQFENPEAIVVAPEYREPGANPMFGPRIQLGRILLRTGPDDPAGTWVYVFAPYSDALMALAHEPVPEIMDSEAILQRPLADKTREHMAFVAGRVLRAMSEVAQGMPYHVRKSVSDNAPKRHKQSCFFRRVPWSKVEKFVPVKAQRCMQRLRDVGYYVPEPGSDSFPGNDRRIEVTRPTGLEVLQVCVKKQWHYKPGRPLPEPEMSTERGDTDLDASHDDWCSPLEYEGYAWTMAYSGDVGLDARYYFWVPQGEDPTGDYGGLEATELKRQNSLASMFMRCGYGKSVGVMEYPYGPQGTFDMDKFESITGEARFDEFAFCEPDSAPDVHWPTEEERAVERLETRTTELVDRLRDRWRKVTTERHYFADGNVTEPNASLKSCVETYSTTYWSCKDKSTWNSDRMCEEDKARPALFQCVKEYLGTLREAQWPR